VTGQSPASYQIEITAAEPLITTTDEIAAFAIDTPRQGDVVPAGGVEINGWAIGRNGPVSSVRAATTQNARRSARLDVVRPDVAADYRTISHAAISGFSFWVPLPPASAKWRLTLTAELEDGQSVDLAAISGRSVARPPSVPGGHRRITAPDFVIIGAQRGGTTSTHAYLSAHPRVTTAPTKEIHFLTDRHERGPAWYIGQFPKSLPNGSLTGEATPYALFHPLSPRRLHEIAPEAKLIVLLRNPVDRAYSHYLHERALGVEHLTFAEALDAEPARLAGEEQKLVDDLTYSSFAHKHASYVARGDYASQLERWFTWYPRESFLIIRSEDLYVRTNATFNRVTSFLGLPDAEVPLAIYNRTTGPLLDPKLRQRLERHFAPASAALAELLGWDPAWW
jgi:hypothetical protein